MPDKQLRVLLIEDSKDILLLMKMELEGLGYAVLPAKDGETALDIAQRERPDVIISDIKMPGLNGLELIKRLRNIPSLASTPCIALTGYARQDLPENFASDYDAYLSKPADPGELSELINRLTGRDAA